MRYDILLAGVGGQGVLSMAAIIGRAALAEGLFVKQSEVHGMAQRGGAVQAHLRLSDLPIESDLIGRGGANLILSLEPVESLRYLEVLAPTGALITAAAPFLNVKSYPPVETVHATIRSLPRSVIVDAERIADEAGEAQTVNTVMVGAAASLLPLRIESIEKAVRETFQRKGDAVLRVNIAALRGGEAAARPTQDPTAAAPEPRPGDPSMTPPPDLAAARAILLRARHAKVTHLIESDAKNLLDAIGIATPARILLSGPAGAEGLHDPPFPSRGVVLKALAPGLLHKTEAGAVRMLAPCKTAVIAEIGAMARRLDGQPIAGFLLEERIRYEAGPGSEFLLGMRWTSDFGPVVTLGAGGLHAEFLSGVFRAGDALAVFSPALTPSPRAIASALSRVAAVRLATQSQRGRPPALELDALVDVVRRFLALAAAVVPDLLLELEVNPLVVSEGRLVALDGLATFTPADAPVPAPAPARPVDKIDRLLRPRSIAIVGVSEKSLNPGRIILRNVLRAGFDRDGVVVVKPGTESLDGARCVPTLDALPNEPAFHDAERRADLVVLSVSASAAPELLDAIARDRRAESVILIPGGLEEHAEGGERVARMRASIARSRAGAWRGPVVNGGNCLGIRSLPGRYDTFFIPEHKLPRPKRAPDPVAFLTGSGAFAVSKSSKLGAVHPRYTISVGNQSDLTVADYLDFLKSDPEVETFAVYLEGFRPLDGARFLAAADEITASGRTVILYRGGRTSAGLAAASSHTAAIAGDDVVTRALAREAGVVVADTLEEFEDLTRLFAMLRGRSVAGLSLGAVSNAGYETVAMADNAGLFRLPAFAEATTARLRAALERAGLGGIATVRNPLDVTPILDEAGTEQVVRAVLEDPGVDVAVVGCVPMTGALQTLPRGEGHGEDLGSVGAIVPRLIGLSEDGGKAWIAVVDAGPLYDPMARALEEGGVPVFRSADRALRVFGRYCRARLARPQTAPTTVPRHGPEPELVVAGNRPAETPRWGSALIWS